MESGDKEAIIHPWKTQGEAAIANRSPGNPENQYCLESTEEEPSAYPKRAKLSIHMAAEVPVEGQDAASNLLVDDTQLLMQSSDTTTHNDTVDPLSTEPATWHDPVQPRGLKPDQLPSASRVNDYFVTEAPLTDLDDTSRVTSTSTLASSAFSSTSIQLNSTSAPHSPHRLPAPLGDSSIPTTNSASFPSKPPRPTSVPIVTSNSSSSRRRRDGPEYPRYPDQSFAALQSQHYPPTYQPHPLKTRSSHTSQNSSFSSIPSRSSRDQIALMTGAKTVGGTPAQSPGLFSPVYPASRSQVDESEDSQTSTPLMHPAHTQTPKE